MIDVSLTSVLRKVIEVCKRMEMHRRIEVSGGRDLIARNEICLLRELKYKN